MFFLMGNWQTSVSMVIFHNTHGISNYGIKSRDRRSRHAVAAIRWDSLFAARGVWKAPMPQPEVCAVDSKTVEGSKGREVSAALTLLDV